MASTFFGEAQVAEYAYSQKREIEEIKGNSISQITIFKYNYADTTKYDSMVEKYNRHGKITGRKLFKLGEKEPKTKWYFNYDDDENLLEKGKISDGKKKPKLIQEFDQGNLVKRTSFTFGEPNYKSISTFKYRDDGLLSESIASTSYGTYSKETREYNNGKLVMNTFVDKNNDTTHHTIYTYNEKGQTKSKIYGNGAKKDRTLYYYDEQGNLIKKVSGNSSDLYKYNEEGQQTEMKKVKNGAVFLTVEYKYDSNGNCIFDSLKKEYYKYNSQNLIVEKGKVDGNGNRSVLERYEYEFYN